MSGLSKNFCIIGFKSARTHEVALRCHEVAPWSLDPELGKDSKMAFFDTNDEDDSTCSKGECKGMFFNAINYDSESKSAPDVQSPYVIINHPENDIAEAVNTNYSSPISCSDPICIQDQEKREKCYPENVNSQQKNAVVQMTPLLIKPLKSSMSDAKKRPQNKVLKLKLPSPAQFGIGGLAREKKILPRPVNPPDSFDKGMTATPMAFDTTAATMPTHILRPEEPKYINVANNDIVEESKMVPPEEDGNIRELIQEPDPVQPLLNSIQESLRTTTRSLSPLAFNISKQHKMIMKSLADLLVDDPLALLPRVHALQERVSRLEKVIRSTDEQAVGATAINDLPA